MMGGAPGSCYRNYPGLALEDKSNESCPVVRVDCVIVTAGIILEYLRQEVK